MIKNKLSEMMGIRRMNMAETARIAGLSHVAVFKIYHNKTIKQSYIFTKKYI